MRVLIIEDETPAANRLEKMLLNLDSDLVVLNRLDSVESAVRYLISAEDGIDLIFMDIQLADGLSFDIFEQAAISAPVIFTTAFDQYTLKAFKVNSIDYLLKPIDENELEQALAKFRKLYQKKNSNYPEKLLKLVQEMNAARYKERLLIKRGQQL